MLAAMLTIFRGRRRRRGRRPECRAGGGASWRVNPTWPDDRRALDGYWAWYGETGKDFVSDCAYYYHGKGPKGFGAPTLPDRRRHRPQRVFQDESNLNEAASRVRWPRL